MPYYKKPKTSFVGEVMKELAPVLLEEILKEFMITFYSVISLALLHATYNCKIKGLENDFDAIALEFANVLAEYGDDRDCVDYSYLFEYNLSNYKKTITDYLEINDLKDLLEASTIRLFNDVANSQVVTQQQKQELFEIIKGLQTRFFKIEFTDDATSNNEVFYTLIRVEKLAVRMHSLLTNGFTRAPQLIDNNFARHNATLTLDLTSLHQSRQYKFDSFIFKQDAIETINVFHIQGLEFSDRHYALLCDLQGLILDHKITALHFSYSLPAPAPTTEIDYKILALLLSIRQSLTTMEYINPICKPLTAHNFALNQQLWQQRAINVFTARDNLTPTYSYKDIAKALKQPYRLEFSQPQLFAYVIDRIKRLHDSVLYKIYLHAITNDDKYLRRLCETNLPDPNLKIDLQYDTNGYLIVEPNDLQIVDALVLERAGAAIRFSNNFNAQQVVASNRCAVQKLARAPLSTLIAYKQFLCTLNLHNKPEESLELLDHMDANQHMKYLLGTKSSLCCDLVTSKILHFRMPHHDTLRLEHTPLREVYDKNDYQSNPLFSCVIS